MHRTGSEIARAYSPDRTTMTYGRLAALVAMCSWMTTLAGCGATDDESAPSAGPACAFVVTYEGHRYQGVATTVAPAEAKALGEVAVGACNDTATAGDEPAEFIELAEIEGIPASVAIVQRGSTETLLVREDVDFDSLPLELARLVSAPVCEPANEPIHVAGAWRGWTWS